MLETSQRYPLRSTPNRLGRQSGLPIPKEESEKPKAVSKKTGKIAKKKFSLLLLKSENRIKNFILQTSNAKKKEESGMKRLTAIPAELPSKDSLESSPLQKPNSSRAPFLKPSFEDSSAGIAETFIQPGFKSAEEPLEKNRKIEKLRLKKSFFQQHKYKISALILLGAGSFFYFKNNPEVAAKIVFYSLKKPLATAMIAGMTLGFGYGMHRLDTRNKIEEK